MISSDLTSSRSTSSPEFPYSKKSTLKKEVVAGPSALGPSLPRLILCAISVSFPLRSLRSDYNNAETKHSPNFRAISALMHMERHDQAGTRGFRSQYPGPYIVKHTLSPYFF